MPTWIERYGPPALQVVGTVLAVGSMILNVVLSLVLVRAFTALGWLPFSGLALANSIATVLEAIVLLVLLWRRTPELDASVLFASLGKSAAATLVMSAGIFAWQVASDGETRGHLPGKF